jgi:putative heme-binding domain-containing protein
VDWYNKIISHNEVPRAHPDRDKTRGRIWRIKPKGMTPQVADFSKLSNEELTGMLGKEPVAAAHVAWQTLADREQAPKDHWSSAEYAFPQTPAEIRRIGRSLSDQAVGQLLQYAKPSVPGSATTSSRADKQIPARESYDREFERFLVRMFLERQPEFTAKFLDSEAAAEFPTEALVLASLALEPKASASRVAKLLPKLDRAPNDEELLRLAQFPGEPWVGESLKALLAQPATVTKLLSHKTKLDPALIAPLLNDTAKSLLVSQPALALQLISGFQLTSLEPDLVNLVKQGPATREAILALRELKSGESELFATLVKSSADPTVREAAIDALAASRAHDAGSRLLALYPELTPAQRRSSLATLSSSKAGAKAIVDALTAGALPATDLDGVAVERLAMVLSEDPALKALEQKLGGAFREVLALDGSDAAVVDSKITLDGPFTVECWVRLAPGINNADSILGSKGQLDMNFFGSTFRVWLGDGVADVVTSKKPITPDLWTHLAVSRDAAGVFKIYQNGELDALGGKTSTAKFENCKIGWSGPNKGTEGMITEFRVWKAARTAAEIRANFDRSSDSLKWNSMPLGKGARLAKTTDYPPILTADQAAALDSKFAKFTARAHKPGNVTTGKALAAICLACHQIGNEGGQIGPNLSGAGAMGLEAVMRNIFTPNAAMEPGYRIFRLEMKSGDLMDAFYVSEDATAYVVRQPGLPDRRVAKNEVQRTTYIRRSLMPEGLIDGLSDSQISDLFSYLMSLKK